MSTLSASRHIFSASALPASSSICRSCRRLKQLPPRPHQSQRQHLHHARQTQTQAQTPPLAARTTSSLPPTSRHVHTPPDPNVVPPPRWAATPPGMSAPYKLRPANENDDYPVNEDPAKLHRALVATLGTDELVNSLPEELRWLAVTHKSFDHGRRGFNDRLGFLGKRLIQMHASQALVDQPLSAEVAAVRATPDAYGRTPDAPHALKGIENLRKADILMSKTRLAGLAIRYGLLEVIRWKPRQIHDLKYSGQDSVLELSLYAIFGVVALQCGGDVARHAVQQQVLLPLGVMEKL